MIDYFYTRACAKINLFLEVQGRRGDGYHDIVSVFQEIDLSDTLAARVLDEPLVVLSCDDPAIPVDERNLAVKAVLALREKTGVRHGLELKLSKRIPVGAGLGGGSADAAAALRLASQLWGLNLSREELAAIGAGVGSDVPFFLWGGACLCEGRGEIVTPLAQGLGLEFLLLLPPWGISTAEAYSRLRREDFGARKIDRFLSAWSRGDRRELVAESFNRFEKIAEEIELRQKILHEKLSGKGCFRLSGSGSAVWCVMHDYDGNAASELGRIAGCVAVGTKAFSEAKRIEQGNREGVG